MDTSPRTRRALVAAAAVYAACVAGVLLWPAPVDRPAAAQLAEAFAWLHGHGLPRWLGYRQAEWLANVALFVPFGVIAALLGWRVWAATAAAVVASSAAEAAQFAFLPERTPSAWDIAANGLGTALGAVLGTALGTALAVRARRTSADGSEAA
ncbi:VanZ family protein [Sinomonas halotolerans]|uniref:VanZ family protein n=1 Tax=Sinomonas halotolerans TaxID=1644133 RepID=A0ABU9WV24_9MICC